MDRQFRNPEGLGRIAVILLLIWLAAGLMFAGSAAYSFLAIRGHLAGSSAPWIDLERVDQLAMVTGFPLLLAYLAAAIAVGRWIYRINANAHALNGEWMTISPGWNIGYFFIPILNLFRPFTGIRQAWQVSAQSGDPGSVDVPGLLRGWWALWVLSTVLAGVSFQVSLRMQTLEGIMISSLIEVAIFAVDVAATALLIAIIRRLSAMQRDARELEGVFG